MTKFWQVLFVQALKSAQFIPKQGAALHHVKAAGKVYPHKDALHTAAPEFGVVQVFGQIEPPARPFVFKIKGPGRRGRACRQLFGPILVHGHVAGDGL